ncbi:MAG: hypothetical protein PVG60_10550, partial [Desulfarculaceae bacterium]
TMLGAGIIAWFNSLNKKSALIQAGWGAAIARKIPYSIALAVNLGIAPLLFMQVIYGQFVYVSAVLMAVYWLAIFILIILAYYAAYLYDMKYKELGRARAWVQGFSVLVFLVVGYYFTCNLVMMLNPQGWSEYFQRPWGTILPSVDPSLAPRYLHFVFSSAAIGGLALGLWGWWRLKNGDPKGQALLDQGLTWYGVATMVNFAVGAWYLGALPQAVLEQVIGGNKAATFALLAGVLAGLASIPVALSRNAPFAATCALLSVVLMVLFRYAVRAAYLAPYLKVEAMPMAPQYSALVMFLGVLVLGLITVVYMLKLASKAGKEASL